MLVVLLAVAAAMLATASPSQAAIDTPVGTVVAWGGTALPAGWLRADGTAVSRSAYPELFASIGTTYGAGDGVTTFNLPNLQQRFALGQAIAGTGSTLGGSGGTIDHTHTVAAHTHAISAAGAHTHDFASHSHTVAGHRHTGFFGISMPAAGSHNHGLPLGRNFLVVNGSGFLFNLASGGVAIDAFANTTTDGGHSHSYNGTVGNAGSGNNGDGTLTSTSTAPATSSTVGSHSHGGVTGSSGTTTSASNPAFQAVDYLIMASSSATAPCGAIWGTGRASAAPGAILAQFGPVSRTGEANLSGCLGTTFGNGDGSTTFNLPDLRGRFPLGKSPAGTGSVLGGTGGALDHTHTADHAHSISFDGGHFVTMPAHVHDVPGHYHSASLDTTTDGGHNHNSNQGGSFIGEANTGATRGLGGTRDYDTPTSTTTDGAHTQVVSGSVGSSTGPLADNAFAMTASAAVNSSTDGVHDHGGTTNGTTSSTTGPANPAFQTMNWELYSAANYAPAVGTITAFAGTGAPAAGWMIADGTAIDRTQYAALFAAIGTTYGPGNGATFNLPDLRGRFALGKATAGTGSVLGGTGGSLDHVHTASHAHTTATEASHVHSGLSHTHTMPGHSHDFTRTFGSAGNHSHTPPAGGNFWGTHDPSGSMPVTNVLQGGSRGASQPASTDTAWGSHTHSGVTGTVGQAADPSGNSAITSSAADPAVSAAGAHSHTIGTTSPGVSAANPPFLTIRYMIRVSSTTLADNQVGDDTWRNANTGSYDVDFNDQTGLGRFETNVWSGTNLSGTQRQAWTQVSALAGTSYTTNWSLLPSTWSAMAEGLNYVSVRVWTTGDTQSASAIDTFYVKKDTVAPSNVTASATSPTVVAPFVTWGGSTDATSGVAYFRVFRGPSSGGPWTQINSDGATTGSSYTDAAAPFGTSYYLVQAVDNAGNVATGGTATGGIVYHRTPNVPVHSSPANATTNQSLTPTLTASYSDPDANSGTLTYQVCSDAACTSVVSSGTTGSSASGTSPTWTVAPALVKGTTYYWRAQATDAYAATSVWSATWSFTTNPGPTITDNQAGDVTWRNTNSGTYDVDFADPVALASFETTVWSGAGQTGTQRQGWTQVSALAGTSSATNWALLASTWTAMAEGTNYVSVRVTDSFGITTMLVDPFSVRKDVSVTAPASVADGSGADIAYWNATTTLNANWPASTGEAGLSGVLQYEYCIATAAACGGTVARTWTSNGAATSLAASGLALTNGSTYYVAVRTTDNAGNTSGVVSSNGQTIDATAPLAPTLLSPPNGSGNIGMAALTARYDDASPASPGQLNIQLCSDAACATVVSSGTSAAGIATGGSGGWTPGVAAGTYWWRAQGVDSAGSGGPWTGTWQVQLGMTTLSLSVGSTVALPTIVSAQTAAAGTTATVSSNGVNGYQLLASDTSDTNGLGGPASVPDWTGSVSTPSVWPATSYGYFGISVQSATGGRLAKWGAAGGPWPVGDFVNNSYAGLTTASQPVHVRSGFDPASETVDLLFRFTSAAVQPAGAYSTAVTLTLVANP